MSWSLAGVLRVVPLAAASTAAARPRPEVGLRGEKGVAEDVVSLVELRGGRSEEVLGRVVVASARPERSGMRIFL